jgi:hypothetical protein
VSRGKIVDHQITGKEKLAVIRTKDRSLDSLTSAKDKRIIKEINKNSDLLWQEAIAKRKADKQKNLNEEVKPRELSDSERNVLRNLVRKEKRLSKEILALEEQGKIKSAMNRRQQRNIALKEMKKLTEGTIYDTNV